MSGRPDLGRHQRRQALVHEGRRRERNWTDVTKNITDMPASGTIHADRRRRRSTRARRTSRSTSHLMDDRKPYIYKTTDFGATWKKVTGDMPTGHPLDYVLSVAGEPEQEGHAVRGHRPRVLLLDGRRRALDAVQGRAAAVAGDAGSSSSRATTTSSSRPTAAASTSCRTSRMLEQTGSRATAPTDDAAVRAAAGLPPGAQRRTADVRSSRFRHRRRPAPIEDARFSMRPARSFARSRSSGTRGAERRRLGPALRRADAGRAADDAAARTRTSGKSRGSRTARRGRSRTGASAADGHADGGAGQVHRCASPSTARRSRSRSRSSRIRRSRRRTRTSSSRRRCRCGFATTSRRRPRWSTRWRSGGSQIEDLLKANRGKDELEKPLTELDKKILDVELALVTQSDMLSDDKYFPEAYKVYMNLIWLGGARRHGRERRGGRRGVETARRRLRDPREHRKADERREGGVREHQRERDPGLQQGDGREAAGDQGRTLINFELRSQNCELRRARGRSAVPSSGFQVLS